MFRKKSIDNSVIRKTAVTNIKACVDNFMTYITKPFLAAKLADDTKIKQQITTVLDAFKEYGDKDELEAECETLRTSFPMWENNVRREIMKRQGLPECFGIMPDSVYETGHSKNQLPPVHRVTPDKTVASIRYTVMPDKIGERAEAYISYIENIVKCSECKLFERCNVLSTMRSKQEKSEPLNEAIFESQSG